MAKKNVTKNSLFMSAISLLLCISMLMGTTFAWFTDSVESGRNTIQSGNLDVTLDYWDGDSFEAVDGNVKLFNDAALWEPGYTEVAYLKVGNAGSLALNYQLKVKTYSETLGKTKDGTDIKLSDHLVFKVVEIDEATVGTYDRAAAMAAAGSELGLKSYNGEYKSLEKNGDADYVALIVYMPTTVGNEANHDGVNVPSIQLGVELFATQYTSESDTFGNDYDTFANPDITATQTKTLEEGASKLSFALSYGGADIADVTVPADAIADPSQPVTVTINAIDPASTIEVGENTKAYAYDITVTNLKEGLTEDQLVTVVAHAPNALAVMDAYHNGELIEGAVYDEVTGTVTFKTGSFSPYAFSYEEVSVSTLAELRDAVKKSNVEIKLTNDLEINLEAGSADRSEDHVLAGSKKTYYNAVNIVGENVAIDLNGHKITVRCSDTYNGNQAVGALFFVDKNGSLNIIDRAEGGYIKMASSIYMVWAPYESPSYVDIYSGAFIADSYAGDPIGTSSDPDSADGTMQNENSNRALIYAGTGGNMNIYGGYFLYNNTPNDVLNRNNGAFNATNGYEGNSPFITIHDGVMLIDKAYRQNPTNTSEFQNILQKNPEAKPTDPGIMDNSSIKLAKDCELAEVSKSVTIDGKTYSTWYQVIRGITSINVTAAKNTYKLNHKFTTEDFNVYAIGANGSAGSIDDFTIGAVDTSTVGTKTVTITYTNESGKTVTATCNVTIGNLAVVDDEVTQYWFFDGNFNVSGWSNIVNPKNPDGTEVGYASFVGQTYIAPNGETVTGFNNSWANPATEYNYGATGTGNTAIMAEGRYDLVIDNALPYTTLGINMIAGYSDELLGYGYYINDDLSTLVYNAPAIVYDETNCGGKDAAGYNLLDYLGANNGHSLTQFTCYDFEPGETYVVHWVAVVESGIKHISEWTVNMKEATDSDKAFVDTEKPNANVIIMAGQSNMYGASPITDEVRDYYGNMDFQNVRIRYNNINGSGELQTLFSNSEFKKYELGIGGQADTHFGPELALADILANNAAFNDQEWFIIKYAPAGTALNSQWTGSCVVNGQTTNLTEDMLTFVQDAVDELVDGGYDVHIRSFMWMQGESDAIASSWADDYAAAEENLVKRVRTEFAGYATRSVGNVAGSGMIFINAGIADNYTGNTSAQGGPNDWIYSDTVNKGKISNSQWLCSVLGAATDDALTSGPLAGYKFGLNTPSIQNPDQSGAVVNSIYMDTGHLMSKAQAYAQGLENYGNDSDNTDWAHYSATSMRALGELYGSCLQFMIIQNG